MPAPAKASSTTKTPSIQFSDSFGFSITATNPDKNTDFLKKLSGDLRFVCRSVDLKQQSSLPLKGDPEPNLPYNLEVNGSATLKDQSLASTRRYDQRQVQSQAV